LVIRNIFYLHVTLLILITCAMIINSQDYMLMMLTIVQNTNYRVILL
jgi:hypothetical protein